VSESQKETMVKQILVVRKDLNMRKGKIAAQCSHSAMAFFSRQLVQKIKNKETLTVTLSDDEVVWLLGGATKIVAGVDSEQELKELIEKAQQNGITVQPIIDAGKTEFHGVATLTCAAFGPNEAALVDSVTGHLKLL
jgi:peptidyl-tRNA hydrolase, PTH2 family